MIVGYRAADSRVETVAVAGRLCSLPYLVNNITGIKV